LLKPFGIITALKGWRILLKEGAINNTRELLALALCWMCLESSWGSPSPGCAEDDLLKGQGIGSAEERRLINSD